MVAGVPPQVVTFFMLLNIHDTLSISVFTRNQFAVSTIFCRVFAGNV